MHLWEGVVLAMHQIRSEKMKSFFSLLGVIMGVMFLIVVVTIVEGLDQYVRVEVTSQVFGINTVTVRRWGESGVDNDREAWRARLRAPRLRYEDAEAIRERLTIPALIGVESDTNASAVADNGRTATGVNVVGASIEMFAIRDLNVTRGRIFSDLEASAGIPVLVLGKETAEVLFEEVDPLGRVVRLRGFPYRVIGVLEERGSLFGQSLDNFAMAPAQSPIQSITNPRGVIDEIIVQTLDPDQIREAQAELEGIMRTRRQLHPSEPNNFAVETADDAISFWDNISKILFTALPGLVAISLVVGGIVIMNIMLVSVMERTREIGVRKALGARRRDILTQVLIESATLSTAGAILGVAVGTMLAMFVAAISPMPAAVSAKWIVIGVTLGMSVGIMAGVYPATQASKLDPVDALRYE